MTELLIKIESRRVDLVLPVKLEKRAKQIEKVARDGTIRSRKVKVHLRAGMCREGNCVLLRGRRWLLVFS